MDHGQTRHGLASLHESLEICGEMLRKELANSREPGFDIASYWSQLCTQIPYQSLAS